MPEAKPVEIEAKYVFLDVVNFTQGRSVDVQTDIVDALNQLVRSALTQLNVADDQRILLPTGDGICIALLNVTNPFDLHLLLALRILRNLQDYNERTSDPKRRFSLRIGVNDNVDNLVTDVNGQQNIAGAGINMAQRLMTFAEDNHIFVGQRVYEALSQRDKYTNAFQLRSKDVKHGYTLNAYQYVQQHPGLNTDVPLTLLPKKAAEKQLSLEVACYIAHAFAHRSFVRQHFDENDSETIILLWMLAIDSAEAARVKPHERPVSRAPAGNNLDEKLSRIKLAPRELLNAFAWHIRDDKLMAFLGCFARGAYGAAFHIPSQEGLEKLRAQHPAIWSKVASADSAGEKEEDQ